MTSDQKTLEQNILVADRLYIMLSTAICHIVGFFQIEHDFCQCFINHKMPLRSNIDCENLLAIRLEPAFPK
jgi:hypothetical protein